MRRRVYILISYSCLQQLNTNVDQNKSSTIPSTVKKNKQGPQEKTFN